MGWKLRRQAAQRSATKARSGDFSAKSAKQDAKTFGLFAGLETEDQRPALPLVAPLRRGQGRGCE